MSTTATSLTDGGPYSLDKISLPEAHIYHGREFPVAYKLNTHGEKYDKSKVEALLEHLSKSNIFSKLIEDHGTVVLRDTIEDSDDSKADDVAEFVRIVEENRGHVEFQQNGTLGLRDKRGYNLYTASKAPAESRLLQHNEYSRFKRYPITLIFTILDYTATGGDTPLVHGGELFDRVSKEIPGFVEHLSRNGLQFNDEIWPKVAKVPGGVIWNHEVTYGRHINPEDDLTTQKLKAEKIAKEYISDNFKWTEANDLLVSSSHNPVKVYNNNEKYLFSSIAAFSTRYTGDSDSNIRYGDGELFKIEDLDKFKEITDELEYKHHWKSGDIVFVHNYQVSHGKLPYKDGKRVTWVGMWDESTPLQSKKFRDYAIPKEIKPNDSVNHITKNVANLTVGA